MCERYTRCFSRSVSHGGEKRGAALTVAVMTRQEAWLHAAITLL